MKYAVVCPDGAADWPLARLDGRTPLEAARLPRLARLAEEGLVGHTQHAHATAGNGSDVCILSLLGFDPGRYHTGRAPLEAAALGIALADDEVAVRCNTVTVEDGVMEDYAAGHISTPESRALIATLEEVLGGEGRHFHGGTQYRHLLVLRRSEGLQASCTPPHDITGRRVEEFLPRGRDGEVLRELMAASQGVLEAHPVNRARRAAGLRPVTQVWLWGHGSRPKLPAFREVYGCSGALISAVDLLKSLGLLLGLEVLRIPGATGYVDTDYAAKGRGAVEALAERDLVLVHIEAPDECGHGGDVAGKVAALERIDAEILGALLDSEWARRCELRLLVCPDHPTPCEHRTHTTEPVPFVAWGRGFPSGGLAFTEAAARRGPAVEPGWELMGRFLKGELRKV